MHGSGESRGRNEAVQSREKQKQGQWAFGAGTAEPGSIPQEGQQHCLAPGFHEMPP